MKVFRILCTMALVHLASANITKTSPKDNIDRKLMLGALQNVDFQNGASNMLSDGGTKNSLYHLQMLVNQQKALHNYKIVGTWLSDVDKKLDDLRDSVGRRLADMGNSLQRKNSLANRYAQMGNSCVGGEAGMSPVLAF